MNSAVVITIVSLAGALARVPGEATRGPGRIIGGSITSISQYPYAAALLYSWTGAGSFSQACGGTIINSRSILTAAHCFIYQGVMDSPYQWRARVGSSLRNSGGTVHSASLLIPHPSHNWQTLVADVAILRSSTAFKFSSAVAAGSIAGVSYYVPDNAQVAAIGWGVTEYGTASEQLRHVTVWKINDYICRQRYATSGYVVTNDMLCSGWLDVGGRDQCQGDSGGPLIHNNAIVGVCSWGAGCADAFFPGVNARVSTYSSWIQQNA